MIRKQVFIISLVLMLFVSVGFAMTVHATGDETGTEQTGTEQTGTEQTGTEQTGTAQMTGVSGGSIAPMEPPLDSSGNPMKPVLPDGFKDVKIRVNGREVEGWTNNTFYIFFATSPEGNTGWYLYDTAEGRWIRYTDFMSDLAEDGNRTETTENSLEEAEQLGRKIERLENKTAKIEKQIEQAESDMAGKMVQSAAIVGGILLIPMIICVVLLAGISKRLKQRDVQ